MSQPSTISTQPGHPLRSAFELAVRIAQETPGEWTIMTSIAAWISPLLILLIERAVALKSQMPSSGASTVREAFSWDRTAVVSTFP
jgi:hypothetical protein